MFQNLVLDSNDFSDEFVNFIIDVLSDKMLFTKAGIEGFMLSLSLDMDELSDVQKSKIFTAITENYKRYNSKIFCWFVCDFLARNFPESHVLKALENFSKESRSISNKGGIILGLDIVMKKSNSKAAVQKVAEKIFDTFRESKS